MAQGVWIIAEQRDGEIRKITYELVSEGRRLADVLGQDLTVVLLGSNVKDEAAAFGPYGANKVLVTDDSRLEPYIPLGRTYPFTGLPLLARAHSSSIGAERFVVCP